MRNLGNYMNVLKNNFLILVLFVYGCSSINSTYKENIIETGAVEVIATPDRISAYCDKVVKDDDTIAYGFMILFLDDMKTTGIATGMLTSEKACVEWQKEVKAVLSQGNSISLRGFDNGMKQPRIVESFEYTFEKHGTYHSNGRAIDFFSIRNEHGKCFSVNPNRCL